MSLTKDERVELILLCGRQGWSSQKVAGYFNKIHPGRASISQNAVADLLNKFKGSGSVVEEPNFGQLQGWQEVKASGSKKTCVDKTLQQHDGAKDKDEVTISRRDKSFVDKAIKELEDINDNVHDRKQELNSFLDELMEEMRGSGCSLLEDSHYLYSGSSYERSAVCDKADFDIVLILPNPFKADDFELIERHEPGFCKLSTSDDIEDEFEEWFNQNDFLKVEALKDSVFDELSDILDNIQQMNSHWCLKYNEQICSMKVTIKDDDGDILKIDLVPALSGCNLNNIPGMCPLQELLQPLVQRGHKEYYLTLAAAPHLRDKNDYHLLVTIAFAGMEKTCMRSSSSVLNAVRLVKLTSDAKGWKRELGLRSFHIKRVAIKFYADLDELSNWDAYKRLLKYLSNECMSGNIDGFFICNQNTYIKSEEMAKTLAKKIKDVERTIQPQNLHSLFRE